MSGYTYQRKEVVAPTPSPGAFSPIEPTPPMADSIDNYKPTARMGLWIGAGVLLIAAIIAGVVLGNLPQVPSETTPIPTRPLPQVTATRDGGIPFEDASVSGYWRISATQWSTTSVELTVEITVDSGTLHFDLYAYANSDLIQLDPIPGAPTSLGSGFAGPGETVTGTVTFDVTRQPLTLILVGGRASQLSALPVDP